MTLVDERGRILGRFNLVDVALAIVLLGLIPLGYAAYVLFRVPVPRITAITPASRPIEPEFRVTIKGENLRPYMRVSLNDMQGRTFLFKSATEGEVVFGDIPIGTYDVVLYDYAQERGRLPKAFTVAPAVLPSAQLDAAGFLTGLDEATARDIAQGRRFDPIAEVRAVGKYSPDVERIMPGDKPLEIPVPSRFRVPVLLRIDCDVLAGGGGFGQCVAGHFLAPSVYLYLPNGSGKISFLIVDVRPATPRTEIDITIQVSRGDPAISFIKNDDLDVGFSQNQFAGGARVMRVPPPIGGTMGIRVPANPTSMGWSYAGQILRVGAPMTFINPRYQLTGIITAVPPMPPSP